MMSTYNGHFFYTKSGIEGSVSQKTGVYYCGVVRSDDMLSVFYVGKSNDVKNRLLQHLNENKWQDVTHFGYKTCDSELEADGLEKTEINRLKPKYNDQLK